MQLLLNAINAEAIEKLAAICHESVRHAAVADEDFSNPPWKDLSDNGKREVVAVVRHHMDNGFPTAEDDSRKWMFRTTLLSVLSIWSGAPQMGPQINPLKYVKPEPEPPAEVEPEPEPEPKEPDIEIKDEEEDEEELSPQQRAARTRAANKAKENDNG